ncbi:major facilitator, sugar transporter-like, Major facilitator superfamily domain protein [Artemisia annua]|uniref:Major facilitator, sugar transporter-like, Major facilitator superfamily domain protein n=1 Tax=Artemisia annua TaxID=35608 RepID=A0A2U1NQU8_ARTAN|nr:major facilitator, sugar transporter-like, Major facilitator superfamily domain protein [Artemisia annua]
MAGRVVAGIGVGYSSMIAPVYTAKLSPAMTRGLLKSLLEVFITLGILLRYVMNYTLSGLPEHIYGRLMLGFAAIPAGRIAVGVMFMPESPRWLVMKGIIDEAQKVLGNTTGNENEAHLRLKEITKAALDQTTFGPNGDTRKGQGVWKELFKPLPMIRRVLITACEHNRRRRLENNGNGKVDKIYRHPESKKQLRSLNEVRKFIKENSYQRRASDNGEGSSQDPNVNLPSSSGELFQHPNVNISLAGEVFISALLMSFAQNFGHLMAGRVVAGIVHNIGDIVRVVMNYTFSGLPEHIYGRLMLGFAAIPAVGIAVGVMFMPESPRWLVMKGIVDEAQKFLRNTTGNENEAHLRLKEITKAALDQTTFGPNGDTRKGQGVWKELFKPSPMIRRVLIVAIGI